ncbi:hypothetical protein CPB85DRAFT_1311797 [Mucidula mucida]|nr:hypothetical protein CPB85DRAFT_1311797 [Mucidula mucida]
MHIRIGQVPTKSPISLPAIMSEPIIPAEYVGKSLEFIMQRENKKLRLKRDIKKWVSRNRDKRCKTCEHARKKCERTLEDVACRSSVCLAAESRCSLSDDELFERIATAWPELKRQKFDVLASLLPKPPSSTISESERVHTDLLTTYFVPLKTPSSSTAPSRAGSAVSSELSQPPDSDSEESLGRAKKPIEGSSQSHCDRSTSQEGADVGTLRWKEKVYSRIDSEDKTVSRPLMSRSPTAANRAVLSQLSDLQEKLRDTESRLHESTNQIAILERSVEDANERMNTFRDQDEQLTSLKVQLVREKVDNRGLRQRVVACDDESSAKSGQIRELEKALIGVKASQEALQNDIHDGIAQQEKRNKEDIYDLTITQRSLEYALVNAKDMDGLRKTIQLQLPVLDGIITRRTPLKVSQETGQAVGNDEAEGRSSKRQKTGHIFRF